MRSQAPARCLVHGRQTPPAHRRQRQEPAGRQTVGRLPLATCATCSHGRRTCDRPSGVAGDRRRDDRGWYQGRWGEATHSQGCEGDMATYLPRHRGRGCPPLNRRPPVCKKSIKGSCHLAPGAASPSAPGAERAGSITGPAVAIAGGRQPHSDTNPRRRQGRAEYREIKAGGHPPSLERTQRPLAANQQRIKSWTEWRRVGVARQKVRRCQLGIGVFWRSGWVVGELVAARWRTGWFSAPVMLAVLSSSATATAAIRHSRAYTLRGRPGVRRSH